MYVRQSCDARVSVSSRESGIPIGLRRRGDTDVDRGVDANVPWNSDGAKHTAKLLAVIWLSIEWVATLCKNSSKYCNTSRCSSGNSRIADCVASGRTSAGKSINIINPHQIDICSVVRNEEFVRCLRWKMATNVSDIFVVNNVSGNSRKYCFTMSAISYACCKSNVSVMSPFDSSITSFNFWMRDFTPDLRNMPTCLQICQWHNKLNSFVSGLIFQMRHKWNYLVQSIQSQPL